MSSTIKVDNIQNQCGANIINESSNTITIGASGDTVSLASGASQTGFGRTGTVDWQTTKKTADFTAVNGEGYFVDTNGGAITATLPASPSAGDIVALKDYALTFATNNLTIGRNSSNINGIASDVTIDTDGASVVLVYVDGTKGWIPTQDDSSVLGASYVTATGGTITTCGNFKIHTFTGPGTFTVSCAGNPLGSTTVDYLVVAGGGGGGGWNSAGGGGGGGWRASDGTASGCYAAGPAPLVGCVSALSVTAQGYPITVGSGGAGGGDGSDNSVQGNTSTFSTISSAGGGGGGGQDANGKPGGSGGGGGGGGGPGNSAGGTGNTPPVSPPQGNNGGAVVRGGNPGEGGGGGGAGATGCNGVGPIPTSCRPASVGGDGANGAPNSITGSATFYAGGGGGGSTSTGPSPLGNAPALGGSGGGGNGGAGPPSPGTSGTANTGGGGGGARSGNGGGGGSGIVVIRYKFQ